MYTNAESRSILHGRFIANNFSDGGKAPWNVNFIMLRRFYQFKQFYRWK